MRNGMWFCLHLQVVFHYLSTNSSDFLTRKDDESIEYVMLSSYKGAFKQFNALDKCVLCVLYQVIVTRSS